MTLPRTPRKLAVLGTLLALSTSAVGCAETAEDERSGAAAGGAAETSTRNAGAAIRKGLETVSIPKQLDNPYEEIEQEGVTKALEELGGANRVVGPTDAGAASQVPLIEAVRRDRPDALIVAGNDPDAVAPALEDAAADGVKVVAMDSDVARDARTLFVNQARSTAIGRDQVRILAEQVGDEGEIAILSTTANAANQNGWIAAMKDELERHPDLELVSVVYGEDDEQTSFQKTRDLLRAHPDLKGIIAPTAVGIAAAARYLSGAELAGKVALTGLGTPNQMRPFVEDGTVEEFALWNPEDVGYLAGYAAAALASGQITGARGERFAAGRLGERVIGADGEIVLGPPTRFNAGNVDDYDF